MQSLALFIILVAALMGFAIANPIPVSAEDFNPADYPGVIGIDEAATEAFNKDFEEFLRTEYNSISTAPTSDHRSSLTSRTYLGTICNISGNTVPISYLGALIDFLQVVADARNYQCGAGPQRCNQIAGRCYNNVDSAVIYLCNDRTTVRTMPCHIIGGGAANIVNDCQWYYSNSQVKGMATYDDEFNIQIRRLSSVCLAPPVRTKH